MINIITSTHELLEQIPLFLLSKEEFKADFKVHFQSKSPSIYADIESFSANPNCTCKTKVKNYISQHKEEMADIINSFFENKKIDNIEEIVNEIRSSFPVNLNGKILKTTVKNWETFGKVMEKNIFRAFSVTRDGEDLYVYFL